jgi:hypothetical protein
MEEDINFKNRTTMKKMILFTFTGIALLLTGCEREIDFLYQGKDGIQFKCYTIPNSFTGTRAYFNSQTFSFGQLPADVKEDTARIVVEYTGRPSNVDRTYYVSILHDSTTAKEGVHYKVFAREQKIRAGMWQDTLKIVIIREHLNTSFNNPVDERLQLVLQPSEDFDLGVGQGVQMSLLMNDYLTKPAWWDSHMGLYYYHPLKWLILISFSDRYSNPNSCPFNINNDGRQYTTGLSNYLNAIPTYDEETGARLFLTTMQLPQ